MKGKGGVEAGHYMIIMDRGRRARGVGINCLVALEREAWRNECYGNGYSSRHVQKVEI